MYYRNVAKRVASCFCKHIKLDYLIYSYGVALLSLSYIFHSPISFVKFLPSHDLVAFAILLYPMILKCKACSFFNVVMHYLQTIFNYSWAPLIHEKFFLMLCIYGSEKIISVMKSSKEQALLVPRRQVMLIF